MNLVPSATRRHTTKAYDPARKIPEPDIRDLLDTLRLAPSSVNSQPWHFVVASDDAGKARIAKAAQGGFAYNERKVLDASHVVVFAVRNEMTPAHLEALLAQEQRDGRFRDEAAKAGQHKSRKMYVDLHQWDQKDAQHWMDKQTYLALGTLLLGAAVKGIDATPMEGFDAKALDAELGLREKGYASLVLCGLGYHGEADFNATLPKSRLPRETVFTYL